MRKLSPLKYEDGRARDSVSRCLMSTRAASQPNAKNRGKPSSSHQYSNSILLARIVHGAAGLEQLGVGLPIRTGFRVAAGGGVPQLADLATLAVDQTEQGNHTQCRAQAEEQQQHQRQRRAPLLP